MPLVFDKAKLKPDCANCDALCCVALQLPYPHYPKPARVPCKNLDQACGRCTIFDRLEAEGFDICRSFDCYGAGPAVAKLFRGMGKGWLNDPAVAAVEFHVFAIVYFALVRYLHPDWPMKLDVPEEVLDELAPFTDAALQLLAESADPFEILPASSPSAPAER